MKPELNQRSERLLSIDALRGLDMLLLSGLGTFLASFDPVFGNAFTASLAKQMSHSSWIGLTVWDMVMPLFMFITGCSMVFSFEKRLLIDSKKKIYSHVIMRVVVLWILGMVVQGNFLALDWQRLYLFSNTLQAIAIGYLGSSLILLLKGWRAQASVTAGLAALYWAILHWVPVPAGNVAELTPEGNIAAYVDLLVMGRHDDGPTYTWVLSSLTFIVTVMLGCFCGKILKNIESLPKEKAIRLFSFSAVLLLGGYLWTLHDPCIKPIWSSSFTLISGGYCVLALALFFLIIDVLNCRRWALPLVHIGSNALFVYLFFGMFFSSHSFVTQFLYGFQRFVGDYYPLLINAAAVALVWAICFLMFKKKIFIKI